VPIREAGWAAPFPVDPGEHALDASAPHKKPYHARLRVDAGGRASVTVPALEDEPAPVASVARGRRTASWIVGGAAAASLAGGAIFGGLALDERAEAERRCGSRNPCPSAAGVGANDRAKSFALASDITLGAGVAAAGLAVYLFVTSRPMPAPPALGADVRGDGARLSFTRMW
jgi:hypothetical protein